jgi:hypothetical protein
MLAAGTRFLSEIPTWITRSFMQCVRLEYIAVHRVLRGGRGANRCDFFAKPKSRKKPDSVRVYGANRRVTLLRKAMTPAQWLNCALKWNGRLN